MFYKKHVKRFDVSASFAINLMMIKWAVAGTTSYPKYLNTWHLLLKAFCSKFLMQATQSHNLVSALLFKSDDKKPLCLIPNDTDCHMGLTSCLRLTLKLLKCNFFDIFGNCKAFHTILA